MQVNVHLPTSPRSGGGVGYINDASAAFALYDSRALLNLETDLSLFLDMVAGVAGVHRAPRRPSGNTDDLISDAVAAQKALAEL